MMNAKSGVMCFLVMMATVWSAQAASQEQKKPEIRTSKLANLLIERPYAESYATEEQTFELAPANTPGWRLEYMVTMKAGDALLYSLTATEPVVTEFHGEFNDALVFYREEPDTRQAHGQLIAPADGKQGWYIANTTSKPVTVKLRLSGRYDKIPGLTRIGK
ncbi:hypothetical protein [Pseudoxanthomonas indica]|uniref:Uncharacterized protein n=1 Tax=Pseudoxanthomonas indica TaxID=428993 RepID=A0A1T5M1Y8_9GAMM|nr:hypothetical protein [Pseudoxanthomonas indica]GGD60612.1 hypothetical protein GCM10007235_36020 [Pseudoxanthomonas indica]SKC82226.1 hypothetical protein SAMN06296058_3632 [Pseudoxanthomonas indica]